MEKGYQGKISVLRDFVRQRKPQDNFPLIRFETAPGKQMQVDWASFRKSLHRLSAFVAILGFSRRCYVEFVGDETLPTLLRCHEHAFEYFAGVPYEGLYDNMRTVITTRDYYGKGQHRLQAAFWDFCKHYSYIPRVCRPYRPQTKGKVERFIRYLKNNFYYPLATQLEAHQLTPTVLNPLVLQWLNTVANCRVHETTQCQPNYLFEKERAYLQPIAPAYQGVLPYERTIEVPMDYLSIPTQQHDLSLYEQLI